MTDPDNTAAHIRNLLEGERLGVLATTGADGPHASLVGFAVSTDLRQLFFATPRSTRKFRNLEDEPRVALLIDRREAGTDFERAAAVTVNGIARALGADEVAACTEMFLQRHPYFRDFLASPNCALVAVEVSDYRLVRNFQNVTVWRPA